MKMASFIATIRDALFGPLLHPADEEPEASASRPNSTSNGIPSAAFLATKPSLRRIEVKLIQQILNTIAVPSATNKTFDNIVGQQRAQEALILAIKMPVVNPQLFTGNLTPSKGILFFGPPGNGKTLLGKAVANAVKNYVTFFYITSSSLTSKYYGEPAKLVEALFAIAKECEPSIIFIDEVDSIFRESDNENEATTTLRSQFQSSMDGFKSDENDRVFVIGTTNKPENLPQAILRRFDENIYVGPPNQEERLTLLKKLMKSERSNLKDKDYTTIATETKFYSLNDVKKVVKQASLKRVKELTLEQIRDINRESLRHITLNDFQAALKTIRPSLTAKSLDKFEEWNKGHGVLDETTTIHINTPEVSSSGTLITKNKIKTIKKEKNNT